MALEEGVVRTKRKARRDEAQGQWPLQEHWSICDRGKAQFGVRDRAGSGVTLGTQPGVNVRGPSMFRFWGQG